MDSGVLYLTVAFAGVWLVLLGYGAQLRRRAQHAAQALAAGDAGPDPDPAGG